MDLSILTTFDTFPTVFHLDFMMNVLSNNIFDFSVINGGLCSHIKQFVFLLDKKSSWENEKLVSSFKFFINESCSEKHHSFLSFQSLTKNWQYRYLF